MLDSRSAPGSAVAYVDESEPDGHSYLLCAAIVRECDIETARAEMERVRPAAGKAHWHDPADRRRRFDLIATADQVVAGIVLMHLRRPDVVRAERRRRLCMERLCSELVERSVQSMVFESRGPSDDRRDRDHLDALRSRRILSRPLRIDHLPGPAEPLLWIADIVCGAYNWAQRGDERYLARLATPIARISL